MALEFRTGFYFSVSFAGSSNKGDAAFQEASGLSKELKTEEITCGGENRFTYKVPAKANFQNLVLKRGIASTVSPLVDWCAQTLDDGLSQPVKCQDVQVNLLDAKGNPAMTWNFVNAYPLKWQAADLKSQESAILIESIELGFNYFDIAQSAAG